VLILNSTPSDTRPGHNWYVDLGDSNGPISGHRVQSDSVCLRLALDTLPDCAVEA